MDIKSCIVTLLSLVVVNNFVISKATGLPNAMLKNRKQLKNFAVYSALVLFFTTLLSYYVNSAFASAGLDYLSVFVTVVLGLGVAAGLKKTCKVSNQELLLVVFNSTVVAMALGTFACETTADVLLASCLPALGYVGAMYTYTGLVSKIDNNAVVPAFRGLPIEMVALGIVALAALAFK